MSAACFWTNTKSSLVLSPQSTLTIWRALIIVESSQSREGVNLNFTSSFEKHEKAFNWNWISDEILNLRCHKFILFQNEHSISLSLHNIFRLWGEDGKFPQHWSIWSFNQICEIVHRLLVKYWRHTQVMEVGKLKIIDDENSTDRSEIFLYRARLPTFNHSPHNSYESWNFWKTIQCGMAKRERNDEREWYKNGKISMFNPALMCTQHRHHPTDNSMNKR